MVRIEQTVFTKWEELVSDAFYWRFWVWYNSQPLVFGLRMISCLHVTLPTLRYPNTTGFWLAGVRLRSQKEIICAGRRTVQSLSAVDNFAGGRRPISFSHLCSTNKYVFVEALGNLWTKAVWLRPSNESRYQRSLPVLTHKRHVSSERNISFRQTSVQPSLPTQVTHTRVHVENWIFFCPP